VVAPPPSWLKSSRPYLARKRGLFRISAEFIKRSPTCKTDDSQVLYGHASDAKKVRQGCCKKK
jgi:hypothetical protein